MNQIIQFTELQQSPIGREFEGNKFEGSAVSFILVDAAAGEGVQLHSHPYPEIFIVQEGSALFTIGKSQVEAKAGQILIVPPDVPHTFVNTGSGKLRQVDIHLSPGFITKWLDT